MDLAGKNPAFLNFVKTPDFDEAKPDCGRLLTGVCSASFSRCTPRPAIPDEKSTMTSRRME